MASIQETLEHAGKLPPFYKRYVDDTLTIMPDTTSTAIFLQVLNNCYTSVKFTMETEVKVHITYFFLFSHPNIHIKQ